MSAGGLALATSVDIVFGAMDGIACATLTTHEMAQFARHGRRVLLPACQLLFQRGDAGHTMYVIDSGMVELDAGENLPIRRLGASEFFGEQCMLLGNSGRTAGVQAAIDTVLLELEPEDFQRLLREDPDTAVLFMRRVIRRMTSSEQQLIDRLRHRNNELEAALDNLYVTTHQLTHTEGLAGTDELTGLKNRRGLTLYLQQCRRNGGMPDGLLLIDCDGFKQVNDVHGHLCGDRVLQNLARILLSQASEGDIACRLGGDEFCLLVRNGGRAAIAGAAGFILDAVSSLGERYQDETMICPISIGAVQMRPDSNWNEAYNQADGALYRAKREGGQRVCWHGE